MGLHLIVYLYYLNFYMTFLLITIFILLPYVVLIMNYRKSWIGMKDFIHHKPLNENNLPFISIIIAARNEENNIWNCIQSLINQTYPQNKFEIIVTNDHSTDNTVPIINSFQKENIRVINLIDFTENVTTDADCTAPSKWLETLASFYIKKRPVFIALPVLFNRPLPEDSFFKKFFKNFQSLDFMTLQGITGASVYNKFHSMCNGANLAYKKEVFYEVGGFEGIDNIASGDDMLLMHKIQKVHPDKIMFLKSPDVIILTQPAETLKDFMNQRIRWASKADKYTDKKITGVLLLVYLLNAWIFILVISSFFFIKAFYLFLFSVAIKTIVELIFLYPVAKFFNKRKLLWWFVPAQPLHILYTLLAGWLGMFGSYHWKGRKVN